MAFTYDLGSANAGLLNISKVRLEIGDTVSGVGVRPDGSNLSNEEIQTWLTAEGDDVMLAAARACDALARMWSTVGNEKVGPLSISLSQVSERFEKQAVALRSQNSATVVYFT